MAPKTESAKKVKPAPRVAASAVSKHTKHGATVPVTASKRPAVGQAPVRGKAALAKPAAETSAKVHPKKALTAADREEFRKLLLGVRSRLAGQIVALKDDSLRREDSINNLEDGTDAFERQLALTLVSSEQDALFAIDESIRKLDEGSYGSCDDCGMLIEKPRLKALPFVQTCIACQSKREQSQGRSRTAFSSRSE
jgi:DnaK suppressor protein